MCVLRATGGKGGVTGIANNIMVMETCTRDSGFADGKIKDAREWHWEAMMIKEGYTRGSLMMARCKGMVLALYCSNGGMFKGEFADGNRQGNGAEYNDDGAMYQGEWRENNMHGTGTHTHTFGQGGIPEARWVGLGEFGRCASRASRGRLLPRYWPVG